MTKNVYIYPILIEKGESDHAAIYQYNCLPVMLYSRCSFEASLLVFPCLLGAGIDKLIGAWNRRLLGSTVRTGLAVNSAPFGPSTCSTVSEATGNTWQYITHPICRAVSQQHIST